MNIREGARRLRWMGMVTGIAPLVAWVLYFLYQIEPFASHSGFGGFEVTFSRKILAGAIVLACPGAVLWLSGWVLDGFAQPIKTTDKPAS